MAVDVDALKSDLQALKSDVQVLRSEVKSDIEMLRVEMRELDARGEARLESRLNSQTKTLVGLMSAQVVAVAGLAFAAARLA